MDQKAEYYAGLAREGETKKIRRDSFSPPETSQEPLDKSMRPPHTNQNQTDLPEQGGIIQRRIRGAVIAPIPTNQTQNLDGQGVERNHTRRGMTELNGTDSYIRESIAQGSEPDSKHRMRALAHIWGKTRGIIAHAQKKKDQNV